MTAAWVVIFPDHRVRRTQWRGGQLGGLGFFRKASGTLGLGFRV